MRILKNKINKALHRKNSSDESSLNGECAIEAQSQLHIKGLDESKANIQKECHPKTKSIPENPRKNPSDNGLQTKNIVKNYGKALCSFASSNLCVPYLESYIKNKDIDIDRFMHFFRCRKELIGNIESFKSLFIPSEEDNQEIQIFKKAFQEVSIIFIKYFSVNWIYHGKLTQKEAHLKYRFKMLRRIKNPENFTHLKS